MRIASAAVSVSSGAQTTPVPSPSAEIRLTLALISDLNMFQCFCLLCEILPFGSGQPTVSQSCFKRVWHHNS